MHFTLLLKIEVYNKTFSGRNASGAGPPHVAVREMHSFTRVYYTNITSNEWDLPHLSHE